MIANIYYIIPLPYPALQELLKYSVEKVVIRENKLGNKKILKLPIGAVEPVQFSGFAKYTHTQLMAELQKTEWKHTI